MDELKRTPLYEKHVERKGKMVDFAGYELPIQYENISEEHHQVRNEAGVFDVSHMGEVFVEGEDALAFVQNLVTNDVKSLVDGQVLYTLMCYPSGTVVDDLLVYRYSNNTFLLVINAANVEKDVQWIKDQVKGYKVIIDNVSDAYTQLAIQGPMAQSILQSLVEIELDTIEFFRFKVDVNIRGIKAIISRTGYTGEDGFEIYVKNKDAISLWEALFDTNASIKPIGLGARDTLRFEACLPLYGHEISDTITPLEAGLKMFIKLETDDFIGKTSLVEQLENGVQRKLIGVELEKGIAREGSLILLNDEEVGYVTTGYKSPTLNKTIALALVSKEVGKIGSDIQVKVRKKIFNGKVISKRFYKKNYKK